MQAENAREDKSVRRMPAQDGRQQEAHWREHEHVRQGLRLERVAPLLTARGPRGRQATTGGAARAA